MNYALSVCMCLHVYNIHTDIYAPFFFSFQFQISLFISHNQYSVVVYSCEETIFMTYTGNHFLVDLWLFSQVS